MIVASRIAAGIAAAAVLGGLLAACTSGPSGSAAPSSAPVPTTTASSAATSANPVASRTLQFPNKNVTVTLTGYDAALHMVQFQVAVWVAGGPDDGHYATDPKDPATHRLALASGATLTSFSPDCTGKTEGSNPNTGGSACSMTQFVSALTDDSGSGPAKLHVNANDQIDAVQGLYHP